jgi:hypothetical protein
MTIKNDQDFRSALDALTIAEQRSLGACFVESVAHLCQEPVIQRALEIIKNPQHSAIELKEVFKNVKSLVLQTHTNCGDESDWSEQAAHFVVVATRVCFTPESQIGVKHNIAWKCAIQCRLAKNCEMIDSSSDKVEYEAQKQYVIAENYLQSKLS